MQGIKNVIHQLRDFVKMFINKKVHSLSLLFFSLISGLGSVQTVHSEEISAGVFIMDTKNQWTVQAREDSPEEKFGYIICNGGYLGSPLITNEKRIVDRYLEKCRTGKRLEAYSQLPIIDVPENYSESNIKNLAYKVELNGHNYYLCKGHLNSTNWCSASGEEKAQELSNSLEEGQDISEDIAAMKDSHERGRNLITNTNSNSNNISSNNQVPIQAPAPVAQAAQIPQAPIIQKAIKITPEDLEAVKSGRINIQDLASQRETIDLNNLPVSAQAQIQQLSQNNIPSQIPSLPQQQPQIQPIQPIIVNPQSAVSANNLFPPQAQIQQLQPILLNPQNNNFNNNLQAQYQIQPMQQQMPALPQQAPAETINISYNDYMALQSGSITPEQLIQNVRQRQFVNNPYYTQPVQTRYNSYSLYY